MTKAKKTAERAAVEAATASRVAAEAANEAATEAAEEAHAVARALRAANQGGDRSVLAMDLLTADAEVARASGLAAAAAAALEEARAAEGQAIAAEVAEEVYSAFAVPLVEQVVTDANSAMTDAIRHIIDAVEDRERACREAGTRLHDAGVPLATTTGRMLYRDAQAVSAVSRREVTPTTFRIEIDGEVVGGKSIADIRREIARRLDDTLGAALSANGYRIGTYGVVRK